MLAFSLINVWEELFSPSLYYSRCKDTSKILNNQIFLCFSVFHEAFKTSYCLFLPKLVVSAM